MADVLVLLLLYSVLGRLSIVEEDRGQSIILITITKSGLTLSENHTLMNRIEPMKESVYFLKRTRVRHALHLDGHQVFRFEVVNFERCVSAHCL